MPGRNGMGPMGRGPLTGLGMGVCVGSGVGQFGAGRGLGRGCRRGEGGQVASGVAVGVDAETQKEALLEQKSALQNRLEVINKELEKL